MNGLLNQCYSLSSLPDISRWDTSKVNNMKSTFGQSISLISIPDILK